jgi:hypothetical protein
MAYAYTLGGQIGVNVAAAVTTPGFPTGMKSR